MTETHLRWTVPTPEWQEDTAAAVVWRSSHQPDPYEVRVTPVPGQERHASPAFAVAVARDGTLYRRYRPPSGDRAAAITLAGFVVRGFQNYHGVSQSDLVLRLGLSDGAAASLARLVGSWADLARLVDRFEDLRFLDGVGDATIEVVQEAVATRVWERAPVDVVRNPVENGLEGKVAAYVAVPTLEGWRVRKEWREDSTGPARASVLLPIDSPGGDRFDSRAAAEVAARAFAADRGYVPEGECDRLRCDRDALVAFEGMGERREWCLECYREPCSCGTHYGDEDNRVKGLCADCRDVIGSWSDGPEEATCQATDEDQASLGRWTD